MLCSHNPNLESRNYIDGKDFTKHDPCIFVVYPAGAAGDLLISIIDKHYLRTGCEYYGINDTGRVMIYTTDYEIIDIELETTKKIDFNQQWFYNLASQLGERNLNYSLLDQVIFGCQLYSCQDIQNIINMFDQAKVINIYPKDNIGHNLINKMCMKKLNRQGVNQIVDSNFKFSWDLLEHDRVLNIPFGCLFNENLYHQYYNKILNFLNLSGQVISFDYIEYYLNKQSREIKEMLKEYSNTMRQYGN
jgi:hypothetical protein